MMIANIPDDEFFTVLARWENRKGEIMMKCKKTSFWIILICLILGLIALVCLLTDPLGASNASLPSVHSQVYVCTSTEYHNPALHYEKSDPQALLRFYVSADMSLRVMYQPASFSKSVDLGLPESKWVNLGKLEKLELTTENFDDLCHLKNGSAATIRNIRRNSANAWYLRTENDELIYLIQSDHGALCLAIGDRNHDREPEPVIRYVYGLQVDEFAEYGLVVRSGENSVPVTIYGPNIPVANYDRYVHWLTLDLGEDYCPFRVYRNGKELMGYFMVYDAQTYKPLPHLIPSGLDPQTYLFQNADPTREYIVVMSTSTEPDAEFYCFGVRFPEATHSILQGQILAAQDGSFYIRPVAGSVELEFGELIRVPIRNGESSPEPVVGDVITVSYEGIDIDGYLPTLKEIYEIHITESAEPRRWFAVMSDGDPQVATIEIKGRGVDAVLSKSNGESYAHNETVWITPMEGIPDLRGMSVTMKDRKGKVVLQIEYPEDWEYAVTFLKSSILIDSKADPIREVTVMRPTDSKLSGIFDCYLFLSYGKENYRYERQDTIPEEIQAGEQIGVVYEEAFTGERFEYTVFRVQNCIDESQVLVHSKDLNAMWLYAYSPSKAAAPDELQKAKEAGLLVHENSDVTSGQEAWDEFLSHVGKKEHCSIEIANYCTLDPARVSEQYYEAYREDYPSISYWTLSYRFGSYFLSWKENGKLHQTEYTHLLCYKDLSGSEPTVRYVLTNEPNASWDDLLQTAASSVFDAFIDFFVAYTDIP